MKNEDKNVITTVVDEKPEILEELLLEEDADNLKKDEKEKEFNPHELYEKDESGRLIIPLDFPVEYKSKATGKPETLKEVRMRQPKGGDLRSSGSCANDIEQGFFLITRCCAGLTARLVDQMYPSDINNISAVINFLSQPPKLENKT